MVFSPCKIDWTCVHVWARSAKPSAKLLRCEGYFPRACFYIRASEGKSFLGIEESSFCEGICAHDLLEILVRANISGERANQPRPFPEHPRGQKPSESLPRTAAFAVWCYLWFDVSTSRLVCLSGNKNPPPKWCLHTARALCVVLCTLEDNPN